MLARSRGIGTDWELDWQPCDNQCLTWSTNLDPSWQHGSRKPAVQTLQSCTTLHTARGLKDTEMRRLFSSTLGATSPKKTQRATCSLPCEPTSIPCHTLSSSGAFWAHNSTSWRIQQESLTHSCLEIGYTNVSKHPSESMKWSRVSSDVGNENMNLAFHFWFDCGIVSWMIHICIYI